MNALINRFPASIEIDGKTYKLNTDFRVCLKVILAFEDAELSGYEKGQIMIQALFQEIPANLNRAYELAIKFLNCGESDTGEQSGNSERLYSFEKDAKYIFSAIKQSHGIDLEEIEHLHWWKFCYMFLDLREDCFFTKMLYYRKQKSRGKLTKEEREYCNQIRDILDLPVVAPEVKEAENRFMQLLKGKGGE